jgi:transcriptional regulator with XRE-family HTH domain
MSDRPEFGKFIRGLMAKHDLTQEEIAEKLDVKPPTMSNYMKGKTNPEMEVLAKCAKEFSLGNEEIKDLYYKTIMGMITSNQKITLETQVFDSDRLEVLSKILAALVLSPAKPPEEKYDDFYRVLKTYVYAFFDLLKVDPMRSFKADTPPKADPN